MHGSTAPGISEVTGFTALAIRHLAGDTDPGAVVGGLGLVWPAKQGDLVGGGPWLARLGPGEILAIGSEPGSLPGLAEHLAPGRLPCVMASDLSDALVVFELHGGDIDTYLAQLVDAAAIPAAPGRATRCRMIDITVVLLRLEAERLWLVADRPVGAYVRDWLQQGVATGAQAGAMTA